MGFDAFGFPENWPSGPGYSAFTLPDGGAPVESVVDEHGGEMLFTCTEWASRGLLLLPLLLQFHGAPFRGDHRPDDEIPRGQSHIVVPQRSGQ
jgi:hypothetical protein